MLGTFRFILALMVVLAHIHWRPFGLNPGNIAVPVFYFISGYVVTGLWLRLQRHENPLRLFYVDRLLRIYPTYLFVLVVGFVVYLLLEPESYYLSASPGVKEVVENLTIIPLNYYMYNQSDHFAIIPAAWSLGAELQFYLLLPLLLKFPKQLFVASLAVGVAAQIGWIPRDWFSYRLPPGVVHLFLGGAIIALSGQKGLLRSAAWIWLIYVVLLVLLVLSGTAMDNKEPQLYVLGMWSRNPEMLIGMVVGIPLTMYLAGKASNRLDQLLGDLSYGVFLNHFVVYWALTIDGRDLNVPLFIVASVILAAVGWYAAERPGKNLRYLLRRTWNKPHGLGVAKSGCD